MAVLTRMTRTSTEVACERADAEYKIEHFGAKSPYTETRCRAVLDTFDWLEGVRDQAPATGLIWPADDQGIAREAARARDLEEAALRAGGDATRASAVAETLAWFLRDPLADSPS